MYDSKLDILFTSDQVQWLDMDDQGLSVQGVVFLWLLLHHYRLHNSLNHLLLSPAYYILRISRTCTYTCHIMCPDSLGVV